jgi:hypothetical protein
MKTVVAVLLTAATFSQSLWASEPGTGAPLFGTWAVDTSRLPMAPEARPRSVTITFSSAGEDRLRTRVEVVDPAGARLLADGVTPLDGTPTRLESNFEADLSATTMPTKSVLVMQLGKDGTPASTRIFAVDADGRHMVETVTFFGPDGKPVFRRNFFSRVQ